MLAISRKHPSGVAHGVYTFCLLSHNHQQNADLPPAFAGKRRFSQALAITNPYLLGACWHEALEWLQPS